MYRRMIITPGDGYFQEYQTAHTPPKPRYRTHIILFILTVVTTTLFGGWFLDGSPLFSVQRLVSGLSFSVTLLTILGVHEFGHYFAGRVWRVNVTLPYFLPAPFPPVGTFGAVIKMRSAIPSRKALVDIGAAGPIAGFVIAVAISIIGLNRAEIIPFPEESAVLSYHFAEPLILKVLMYLTVGPLPESHTILMSPVLFAGWLGFFVTALNLLPFGQLDGGHILFAVSPKIHDLLRRIRIPLLLLMGLSLWHGWFVWAIILLFLGSRHPRPIHSEESLGMKRYLIAATALILFILCMMPMPVRIG